MGVVLSPRRRWLCSWYKVTQLGCATREVIPRPVLPTVHGQAAQASLWTHSRSSLERRVYELEERSSAEVLAAVRHPPWHSPGPVTSPEEGRCPQETFRMQSLGHHRGPDPGRAPGERGLHSQAAGSPHTAPTTDRSAGPGALGLNLCS